MNTSEQLHSLLNAGAGEECATLCGKFHAHLTFDLAADQTQACRELCRANRVKLTIIDLENSAGRQQTDVMATCHFRDEAPQAVLRITTELARLCEVFDDAGFPVTRAKLEHESLPTFSTYSEDRYHEVHFKLTMATETFDADYTLLKDLGASHGFVPSRNPLGRNDHEVIQFVNMRIYSGQQSDADQQVTKVGELLRKNGFTITETKRETVVYDTARNLDSWWA